MLITKPGINRFIAALLAAMATVWLGKELDGKVSADATSLNFLFSRKPW